MMYWAVASTRTGALFHIVRTANRPTRDAFTFQPVCRWVTWDGVEWVNTWDFAQPEKHIPARRVCPRCIAALQRSIDQMVEARDGMLTHNEALT